MKMNRKNQFRITGTTLPKLFSVALVATLINSTAFAAPPPNDNLANATVIASTLPVSVEGTNREATAEIGEPNHSPSEPDQDAGRKTVWWQWTSPINGVVVLNTQGSGTQDPANPESTDPYVDTQVGVYTGDTIGGLNVVAKGEDSDGRYAHGWTYMVFNAVQGTTYKIAVDGWRGAEGRIVVNLLPNDGSVVPPPGGGTPSTFGLTINVAPAGAGTVSVNPEPGEGGYANGTVVTLTANPGAESVFTAWGGAANGGTQTITVTMNGNKTVNAIFNATSELLVQSADNRIGGWYFNGTDFLGGSLLRNGVSLNDWRTIGRGDFDGDDKTDVLFQHRDGRLAVWHMNGTTFLSGTTLRPIGQAWKARAVADFDGDGKVDIAFQHADGRVALWLMDGTEFVSAVLIREGRSASPWRLVTAADVNADGSRDLIFQSPDGRVAAWMLDGTTFDSGAILASGRAAGTQWRLIGLADMNKDGTNDIIWQNADGRSAVWFLDEENAHAGGVVLRNGVPIPPGGHLVGASN